ncbi:hypothetical protein LguiB_034654 [Lonicera macranthoides]
MLADVLFYLIENEVNVVRDPFQDQNASVGDVANAFEQLMDQRGRAETEERSAMARIKRFERWIEGVKLHLVEATENENGDGVNACGAAGE